MIMSLELKRVNFLLERINTANTNSFSGAIKQLFGYLNENAQKNIKYKYYEKERTKWLSWPGNDVMTLLGIPQWKIPDDYNDSKSLSYHLYK